MRTVFNYFVAIYKHIHQFLRQYICLQAVEDETNCFLIERQGRGPVHLYPLHSHHDLLPVNAQLAYYLCGSHIFFVCRANLCHTMSSFCTLPMSTAALHCVLPLPLFTVDADFAAWRRDDILDATVSRFVLCQLC
jgi:hypothetical protein